MMVSPGRGIQGPTVSLLQAVLRVLFAPSTQGILSCSPRVPVDASTPRGLDPEHGFGLRHRCGTKWIRACLDFFIPLFPAFCSSAPQGSEG